MSPFWSWFLIALVVLNILGCVFLLWYTSRRRDGLPQGETTGHVWDGDITEYNKPLPRWWINLFYLTIVFTIGYLVLYPGFGSADGILAWSSVAQHDAEKTKADALFAERYARFDGQPLPQVAADPDALGVGRNLFANNCAQCHGSDGRGALGFPNLTDANWQWGGEPDTVLSTILHGRVAVMPALGAAVGDDGAVTAVATYVQQLAGLTVDPSLAATGKAKFDVICSACHTVAGTGNPILGAPNLTDDVWLYASDLASIRESIIHGRAGEMPAFETVLGPERTRLVAAYAWALGQPDAVADAEAPGAASTSSGISP